ncbi:cobalt-precorrin-4/precorrin-4 C(11)-methyltransferase [Dehalobacterium formicoaceticum]|uniref:cobalt-precorrin-4/precorrin-4 C(11)-methyltransferase n=1 Tax=Dehalobacterium formicoaceticum TaxID=51515 RepID=UPI000B7FAE5F|nr:SAM-dependent methyltransferase [Dehalobacterium formicoaceticum]
METKVFIVAGGPGDAELMTLKGQRIIDSADRIFFSTRFTPQEMFSNTKSSCKFYDSFAYSYDEKLQLVKEAVSKKQITAFVTMGDPCLYGMIGGLTDRFENEQIDYEVIPGVSSFNAATALLKRGMTGLGLPNTAICTTLRDREDGEEYFNLVAALGASLAIFMSVELLDRVIHVLKKYYPMTTPVVVICRATWPEQQIAQGNLLTISDLVSEQKITDGLILVGEFIDKEYDYVLEKEFTERKKKEAAEREAAGKNK